MNLGSPMTTAMLRGAYLALGMFGSTFLTVWGTTDDLKAAFISGGIAGFAALGFRVGVEGSVDQRRANAAPDVP